MSSALDTAGEVALRLLELAIKEAPAIAAMLKPDTADTTPLADRVRAILPEESAAAKARRELEAG